MSMVLRQITTESEGDKQDFDFPTTATQGLIVDADERVDGEQQHLHVSYDHKIGAWAHRCITQSQNSTDYLVNGNATSGLRGEQLLLDMQTTRRIDGGNAERSINMGLQSEQRISKISTLALAPPTPADDSQNSVFAEYLVDYAQTSLA